MKIKRRGTARQRELDAAFWKFHHANPWIYDYFVARTRELRANGRRHTSVQLLINKARWDTEVGTISWDGYKVNQNHASRYSRLIMALEPDLDGVYRKRRSDADYFDPLDDPGPS